MEIGLLLSWLLGSAVLFPLASFLVILLAGPKLGPNGKLAGGIATVAIATSCLLSLAALTLWIANHPPVDSHHAQAAHDSHQADSAGDGHEAEHQHAGEHAASDENASDHHENAAESPSHYYEVYTLGTFGRGSMTISVYIDALTICMFAMVTLIATCIHLYATGYMSDELTDHYVDHEISLANGSHLHRPGRFHRFFQSMSLFCFSMLGLVLSGNIAMTFVFWELVGICSYFLIGFYVERKSASTAANKAFIVNRIGDFGMIIGLMALWGSLGTFAFGGDQGIFRQIRTPENQFLLQVPDGMVVAAAKQEVGKIVAALGPSATQEEIQTAIAAQLPDWRDPAKSGVAGGYGRWLLIVAGIGIFCGCVGKSAQFPLHVWLPDAMEGPTPVSALVHSATMVAAGVFLVARCYPVFVPEVLFVIAITGTITLFIAATIAITATDIKRVLAYSTVSQLGYMMLALGIGGWLAGVMHLITHAFFKSLLFLCSGSVIHSVHTNEMPEMGGLRKKMPWTAYTMLIGCMAIAGAGLPFAFTLAGQQYNLGLSGYYSKDAIVEQAISFAQTNPGWGTFFLMVAVGGATITAFYMFRLWYLTFAGEPRNQHRYDHAHESPPVMYGPLVLLSVFAIGVAWKPVEAMIGAGVSLVLFGILHLRSRRSDHDHAGHDHHGHEHHSHDHSGYAGAGSKPTQVALILSGLVLLIALAWSPLKSNVTLSNLLEQARPTGTLATSSAVLLNMAWPNEHISHDYKVPAGWLAFTAALTGFGFATLFYGLRILDADEARRSFARIHRFLLNKWWFDELYQVLFVKPAHIVSELTSSFDKRVIDRLVDGLASLTRGFAVIWERIADRQIVDGCANGIAHQMYQIGIELRRAQTGHLRQYVMFIAVGMVAVFMVASFVWKYAFAG